MLKLSQNLITGVKLGVTRWRTDPRATAIDVGVSSIGQVLGWTLFQDFIGIGMKPIWRPGLGHKLSPKIQQRLPATATTAWTLKVIEKLIGVVRHPERVNNRDQVADSISSIYGTWTRNGMSLLLIIGGRKMRNKLPHPQTITIP